jgi:thiol:disulfide interchange protein DsbD
MATSIRWELPEGFTADEISWPVPHLLGEAPEMSYGYEGELLLPVTITPPSDIPSGSSLVLQAHAAWLICEEICISDKADLTLTLATDTKAPAPSGWADLFRKTQQLLPKALAGMKLSASRAGDSYVLNITPDKPVADGAEFMFFAGEEEVINHSALQKQSTDGRTVQLLLRDSDYASKPASRLRGVLVVTGGEKHEKERQAFSIDLPVDGVADATAD